MGRKPTGKPNQRPAKEVDWKLVDELLLANCHGTEIASHFDMHPDTFYRKVQEKFGIGFTEYSTEKKQRGDSLIKFAQYKKALGVGKGDNTMLIWLGKQRLGQRETPLEDVNENSNESVKLDALIKELQALQASKSSFKIDDNSNKAA